MKADLTDKNFKNQTGAILVKGMYSDPHMAQFPGIGYSRTIFKMKALLVDGKVYVPDKSYTLKTPKLERDYENYPMVLANPQPPFWAIIYV